MLRAQNNGFVLVDHKLTVRDNLPGQGQQHSHRGFDARVREHQIIGIARISEAERLRRAGQPGIEAAAKQVCQRGRRTRPLRQSPLTEGHKMPLAIQRHADARGFGAEQGQQSGDAGIVAEALKQASDTRGSVSDGKKSLKSSRTTTADPTCRAALSATDRPGRNAAAAS